MTLAFVTDTRIDISSTEGAGSGTSVGNMSVSEEAEGIVSSFNVSVAAQGSGRLGYTVLVHLKNALLSGTYDYVEIRVAPSDKQIETVEIAGNLMRVAAIWKIRFIRWTGLRSKICIIKVGLTRWVVCSSLDVYICTCLGRGIILPTI